MKVIKRNLKINVVLSLMMLCTICFSTTNMFLSDMVYAQPNSVSINIVDDNHTKLHCNSITRRKDVPHF